MMVIVACYHAAFWTHTSNQTHLTSVETTALCRSFKKQTLKWQHTVWHNWLTRAHQIRRNRLLIRFRPCFLAPLTALESVYIILYRLGFWFAALSVKMSWMEKNKQTQKYSFHCAGWESQKTLISTFGFKRVSLYELLWQNSQACYLSEKCGYRRLRMDGDWWWKNRPSFKKKDVGKIISSLQEQRLQLQLATGKVNKL